MRAENPLLLAVACGLLILVAPAARADDCRLELAASLDMTQSEDGLLVPVTIGGVSKSMIVDTGAPASVIDPKVATELNLITRSIFHGQVYTSGGRQFTMMANVPEMDVERMHVTDSKLLVNPQSLSSDPKIAGLLGADFLRHYDIELDFAAHKLNLFNQNHCPGKVIYWPANGVAVVPIHVTKDGHIAMGVTLDDHDFTAVFDTGAFGTILSLENAQNVFGLKPGSADTPVIDASAKSPYYTHVFKTLSFDGIAINNPKIYIHEDEADVAIEQTGQLGTRLPEKNLPGDSMDFILGMNELRHLHIFVSYMEQKLYITAAAPAQPPAAAPAH